MEGILKFLGLAVSIRGRKGKALGHPAPQAPSSWGPRRPIGPPGASRTPRHLRPGGPLSSRGPPWGPGFPGLLALRDPRAPGMGYRGTPGVPWDRPGWALRTPGLLGSLGATRARRTPGRSGTEPWGPGVPGGSGPFPSCPPRAPGFEGGAPPPPPSRIHPSTTPHQ